MPKFYALLGMGCLALCLQAQAQEADWATLAELPPAAATADLVAGATPAQLGAALAGAWRGSLTYRDYGSGKKVVLPTSAKIAASAGNTLDVALVYDDGPGKTVRSTDTWALNDDASQWRMNRDQLAVSSYRIAAGAGAGIEVDAGTGGAPRTGAGTDLSLVALGSSIENGAPVQVRLVVLRRGDTLTISRATRQPDQPWLLRHRYALAWQPR